MNYNKEFVELELINTNNNEEICEKEINLWRAVVLQSLNDLFLPPSNSKYRTWRRRAREWFVNADEDFYNVCEYAYLCPKKVLKLAHRNINIIENKKIIRSKT